MLCSWLYQDVISIDRLNSLSKAQGAGLLSVNSAQEHQFIDTTLQRIDRDRYGDSKNNLYTIYIQLLIRSISNLIIIKCLFFPIFVLKEAVWSTQITHRVYIYLNVLKIIIRLAMSCYLVKYNSTHFFITRFIWSKNCHARMSSSLL